MIFFVSNVESVLKGRLPEHHNPLFINIVERAKRLLDGWAFSALEEQIENVNWLIYELDPERFPHKENMDVKGFNPFEKDATIPSLIRNHLNEIELDETQCFTWSQYFWLTCAQDHQ